MKNRIIIGSGIGGLIAGKRLAKKGHKVVVVEYSILRHKEVFNEVFSRKYREMSIIKLVVE